MRATSATKLCKLLRMYAKQYPDRITGQWPLDNGVLLGLHKWANSRPSKGAFLIRPEQGAQLWLVISDWKKTENFYVVVFPASRAGPIAELHKIVDGPDGETLHWTYSPSIQDDKNNLRRNYFEEEFGSLDVFIAVPMDLGQVDDFLDQFAMLATNRHLADSLSKTRPPRDDGFPEGKLVERRHLARERNAALIREAKSRALSFGKRLQCACCDFDFEKKYGTLGSGFIEGHHTKPVSTLDKLGEVTRVEDIALVCSNCHRMLHRRRPWLEQDELRTLLK